MKICSHRGYVVSIFTRSEHCPPHVHVGNERWDARFQFSFWHNGVALWDVKPIRQGPSASLLEEFRQVIEQPANLRMARQRWWLSRHSVCVEHQHWDPYREQVVSPSVFRRNTFEIVWARYVPWRDRTELQLVGHALPLEIEL
jgi:hypothetical protein